MPYGEAGPARARRSVRRRRTGRRIGENLFSHQDARNLLRYGGLRPDRDWLQFNGALYYGLCKHQRTLEALKVAGWSPSRRIPHGGHQMSLNIAAGLGLGANESKSDLIRVMRALAEPQGQPTLRFGYAAALNRAWTRVASSCR